MKDHYVSYECAQALKRLGFKEEVSHYYYHFKIDGEVKLCGANPPDDYNDIIPINETCSAPRLDQAAAWIREEKGIDIEPRVWLVGNKREYRPYIMPPKCKDYIACPPEDNYELALSAGISKALELIENGKKI